MNAQLRRILAIIPARGGSKGVPRKNIRLLGGRPLIDYSIRAARECQGIDRVIVSTEDDGIASVARECGAEVPFLRPADLAKDASNVQASIDVTLDMLRLADYLPEAYLVLYPTHPFRSRSMMRALVDNLGAGKREVKTVREFRYATDYYARNGDKALNPLAFDNLRHGERLFRTYGLASGKRMFGGMGCYYHVLRDPASFIDLDSEDDFKQAEAVLRFNGFDFQG